MAQCRSAVTLCSATRVLLKVVVREERLFAAVGNGES